VDEIRGLLTSITTGAEGVEGIAVNMLKMIGDAVMPALEDIVNLSLNNSVFPRLWTKALVTPIPKVANPPSPSDLRPINITYVTSKLTEKVVYRQVLQYLTDHNVIDKFQSGFRPAHSTTTALLHVYDNIKSSADGGLVTVLVLFDFTQAFPTIVHEILFQKMYSIWFSGTTVE